MTESCVSIDPWSNCLSPHKAMYVVAVAACVLFSQNFRNDSEGAQALFSSCLFFCGICMFIFIITSTRYTHAQRDINIYIYTDTCLGSSAFQALCSFHVTPRNISQENVHFTVLLKSAEQPDPLSFRCFLSIPPSYSLVLKY